MAIILACDCCHAQSPDETGRRVADNWIAMTVQPQYEAHGGRAPKRFIFCEECWPNVVNTIWFERAMRTGDGSPRGERA